MVLDAVDQAVQTLVEQVAGFMPNLFAGILFLIAAYIGIKIVMKGVKTSLRARYSDTLISGLMSTIIGLFLWAITALVLLNILGLGEIAASLGTTTGFIALGVAYALSSMIADSVAGYYLVRDPDFQVGDKVETDEMKGEVMEVGLRKSRLELENDDIAVLSNSEIEKKWIRKFS